MDPSSPTTTATAISYGTYILTWTEDNGTCLDDGEVEVTYIQYPTPNAGGNQNYCNMIANLSATPSIGNGSWSSSGTGTATFADSTDANSDVSVDTYGIYTFFWEEDTSGCMAYDSVVSLTPSLPVAIISKKPSLL